MKLHNIFLLLLVCSNLCGQTDSISRQVDNRWSIELDFGQNRAVRPFAEGYYSGDASHLFNVENVSHQWHVIYY